MNILDRVVAAFAPKAGLGRAQARSALKAMMNYDAATSTTRGSSWKLNAGDADTAAVRRSRLAYVARDMIRNTPFAARAQQVIANNVIGDGIIWKVRGVKAATEKDIRRRLKDHLDSTDIDAAGRSNLYGLQRLVISAVVDSGEVLIRRRKRFRTDGLLLPFQIEVLEPDYIDTSKDGAQADGTVIREGIEFNVIGQRVAYWLYSAHPGGNWRVGKNWESRRVPASEILHIYRQDRPGQMRGVSWFAPIAMTLQDLGDHQDAQLMRQKVAACFAAFRVTPDAEPKDLDVPELSESIIPGRIQNIGPGEDIRFSVPPGVQAYDEFTRSVLRSVAAGMGITYEALTGDLGQVNFSSGRMGRMEMDRNVSSWQWLMIVPQMMQPLGRWIIEAIAVADMKEPQAGLEIEWVPPHRMLVDPAREIIALRDKVRAGFASRQGVIRELGFDPEDLLAEQIQDAAQADLAALVFDTDPRRTSAGGMAQSQDTAPNN